MTHVQSIRGSSRFANIALCCCLLVSAVMVYYHQGLFMPRARHSQEHRDLAGGYSFGNDFYQIWFTARECVLQRSNPYSNDVTGKIQIGLYGRWLDASNPGDPKDRRAFPYPAFVDLLFWPVSRLDFPTARIVAFCTLLPVTIAMVLLWIKAVGWRPRWQWRVLIIALVLTSYPVLEGLYAGQIGLLVAFLLAAAILALGRGNLLLSGVLMAFSTIKPQMSALLILYLIFWSVSDLRARRRFCIGLLATAAALIVAALAVWPHWIANWIAVLRAYRGYNPPPLLSQVLGSLFGARLQHPLYVFCCAILLAAALRLAWQNRAAAVGSSDFWFTLSLLLALATAAVLSGQAVYDHVLLLPGILQLASHWRELLPNRAAKTLLTIGAIVLFWPWVAACGLVLLRPLLSDSWFLSKAVFLLPLYFAVGLPFAVVALLALAIRGSGRIREYATLSHS